MKTNQHLLASLLGIVTAFSIIFYQIITFAITDAPVEDIAKITTVLIAEGLQKEDVEKQQEDWNAGSGVIIGKQGKNYYVLTAFHVIPSPERTYGVRTFDGEVHCFKDQDRCEISRLGKRRSDETIEGFDLAVVKFESDVDYPVATFGNSKELQEKKDNVIVSGWPRPEEKSSIREWKTQDGLVVFKSAQPDANGGYSLLYNNTTKVGMSGGPVFNRQGQVVGIHGRGLAKGNVYCINPQLSANNSCGMQMIHFISTSEGTTIQSAFNRNPIDPQTIAQAIQKSGPTTVDLPKVFTLPSRLGDIPSTGCQFHTVGCQGY